MQTVLALDTTIYVWHNNLSVRPLLQHQKSYASMSTFSPLTAGGEGYKWKNAFQRHSNG